MDKFQTPQFKRLQHKWYSKAKKSGFEDAENTAHGGELKKWHSFYLQSRHNPQVFESKAEYFRMAGEFFNHHQFRTRKERRIWELHSEGLSIREIGKKCSVQKDKVHKMLKQLISVMFEECSA